MGFSLWALTMVLEGIILSTEGILYPYGAKIMSNSMLLLCLTVIIIRAHIYPPPQREEQPTKKDTCICPAGV